MPNEQKLRYMSTIPMAVKLPNKTIMISSKTATPTAASDGSHDNSDLEVAWDDTKEMSPRTGSIPSSPSWLWILAVFTFCVALIVAMTVVVVATRHDSQAQASESASTESSLTVYQSKRRPSTRTRPPTKAPTSSPVTQKPTTTAPTNTMAPATSPTTSSTTMPSTFPATSHVTTFYVVGDVPYSNRQAIGIRQELRNIPPDADFVVHVGDLRKAGTNLSCQEAEYTRAEALFNVSRVPVFMILGDNDWNDCPNPDQGLHYWRSLFLGFESKYWTSRFTITRLTGYPETFGFEWKRTLFVGLNLVGGEVLNATEWNVRLTDQVAWVKELISDYTAANSGGTGKVVLFGHADPNDRHAAFFQPLVAFVENDLLNAVPIVYINGDGHRWNYTQSWFGQPSLLRIMVTGGASEPPLKMVIDGEATETDPTALFAYDRELERWNNVTFNYTAR